MPRSRKIKTFSYRLNVTADNMDTVAEDVANWWDGFEFVTGPVMVFWKGGKLGSFQVWAITEAEGVGVIQHALAHMQIPPSMGTWVVRTVENPRFGKTYTVRASNVSCRRESSGPPASVILDKYCLKDPIPIPGNS